MQVRFHTSMQVCLSAVVDPPTAK